MFREAAGRIGPANPPPPGVAPQLPERRLAADARPVRVPLRGRACEAEGLAGCASLPV